MIKNSNSRDYLIHLYNPKEEGLGSYDLNYINACKKRKIKSKELLKKDNERYAAWYLSLEVSQS